jgi:omega-amidase
MQSITISIVQTALFWEDKNSNLSMLEKKIMDISDKTNIVILPEMFSTGFSMNPALLAEAMDGPTIAWMKQIAKAKNVVLTGSLIIEENNRFYNRLIWMLPNGNTGYYDKRHLFAFAGEDQFYTAGNKRLITSVNGWKMNLQICYDLRFPVWARQQINSDEPEFDLLIYVANWPKKRNHAWKSLLVARAIENQSYVVGVNRIGDDGNQIAHSGDSMLVDPMGEIIFTKENEEYIFTCELNKASLLDARSKFPFWKDADPFQILQKNTHVK